MLAAAVVWRRFTGPARFDVISFAWLAGGIGQRWPAIAGHAAKKGACGGVKEEVKAG